MRNGIKENMKKVRLAGLSTPGIAIFLFLGFTGPANAGTCYVELTKSHMDDSGFCNVLSGAGNWVFTYTVTGRVSSFGRHIKNNPGAGDICWQTSLRQPKSGMDIAPNIPSATEGVCGLDFTDTNGDPLTIFAFIQTGDAKAKVAIRVDYPDP